MREKKTNKQSEIFCLKFPGKKTSNNKKSKKRKIMMQKMEEKDNKV